VLKLPTLLKKLKKEKFNRYFSTKININKSDLADSDKVMLMLKKIRNYYKENFEEVDVD
jgi:hypothetical protein